MYGPSWSLYEIHYRFLQYCTPDHFLAKKGIKFEWTTKCEESFQHWKELLISAPILRIADPNEDFFVCINACKEGLGGVLTQNEHAIFSESRKLKEHEKNYATHDLELETLVLTQKMWSHYLMGIKFELRTDFSHLKYLFGQPTLNVRQNRWLEILSKYDFDIKYIKGKENKVVDALSRMVNEMHAIAISMCRTDLKDIILDDVTTDQNYV
jgi:hypothetical protein